MSPPFPGGPGLLIATRNVGKSAELASIAAALGMKALTLIDAGVPQYSAEDALEEHAAFEENALSKARYFHRASGGLPTVADDSGLEVEALHGGPGVRSRRWAGMSGTEAEVSAANNARLLATLLASSVRDARFVCVVAFVDGKLELTARGAVLGRVAHTPRGERGFGYDPVFEAADLDWRTFGEVTSDEKARVSHRGRAAERLIEVLTRCWTGAR